MPETKHTFHCLQAKLWKQRKPVPHIVACFDQFSREEMDGIFKDFYDTGDKQLQDAHLFRLILQFVGWLSQ